MRRNPVLLLLSVFLVNIYGAVMNSERTVHNGIISVGLTIPLGKYFSVVSMIAYSFPLSNDADNLIKSSSLSDKSDFVYGGVTASLSF